MGFEDVETLNDIIIANEFEDKLFDIKGLINDVKSAFQYGSRENGIEYKEYYPATVETTGAIAESAGDIARIVDSGTPSGVDVERLQAYMERLPEIDEYGDRTRLNECIDVTKSIFSAEVFEYWDYLTLDTRAKILDYYAVCLGDAFSVNMSGCVFEQMDASGYNNGDGYIHLNAEALGCDATTLVDVINTVAHECRHQFQREVSMNPSAYGVSEEIANSWRENMLPGNYIPYYLDPRAYSEQPIEHDADLFASAVTKSLMEEIL